MNYMSTSDLCIFLWISEEDILINNLNWIATSYINDYLDIDTLYSSTYTNEEYDYNNNIYYLNNINPTSITSINSVSPWLYKLYGRKLELQYSPINTDYVFNKIKITYVAWYSVIPEDVKAVVYNLVWFLYNNRKAQGINSFSQGQLSVSYANWEKSFEEIQFILAWLDKYKKNIILS